MAKNQYYLDSFSIISYNQNIDINGDNFEKSICYYPCFLFYFCLMLLYKLYYA